MGKKVQNKDSIQLMRNLLVALCAVLLVAQISIDSSYENAISLLMTTLAFVPAVFLFVNPRNSVQGKYHTAALGLFLVSANSLIPMLGTTLEGHSIVHGLTMPITVFAHRALYAICVVLAHLIAGSPFLTKTKAQMGKVADIFSLRRQLPFDLIVMSIPAWVAFFILRMVLPEGPMRKLLDPAQFVGLLPYLMLVPPFIEQTLKRKQYLIVLAVLYAIQISIGVTSRMTLVLPIAVVASGWLVSILSGEVSLRIRDLRYPILASVPILLLSGQMGAFSTAILRERAYRDQRTMQQNVVETISTYLDRERLDSHRSTTESNRDLGPWYESYIENPFLDRFTSVKYDDILFVSASTYDDATIAAIREFTLDTMLCMLMPEPVLKLFGFEVDKAYVNSCSMGDYMDYHGSRLGNLGEKKVGSFVVHSFVLFSWLYPVPVVFLLSIVFVVFQTLAWTRKRDAPNKSTTFAILFAFIPFLDLSVEGIQMYVGWLGRGFFQIFIIYALYIKLLQYSWNSIRPRRSCYRSSMKNRTEGVT